MFDYFWFVMSWYGGAYQVQFSGCPVDTWVGFGQPGVSEDVVVLSSQVYYKEILYGGFPVYS